MEEVRQKLQPNPILKAGWISQTFWCYLDSFFKLGWKKTLEVEDLHELEDADTTKVVSDKLTKAWDIELEKQKAGGKPNLGVAYFRAFGLFYMVTGILAFLQETVHMVQPFFIGGLIRYFTPDSGVESWQAYCYAVGTIICCFGHAVFHHPFFHQANRIGMWLRVASSALIYRKALRLNHVALGKTTTGQIVNLMTNDVTRFDVSPLFIHYLWLGPIMVVVVLVWLWIKIGPSCLVGVAVLFLLIPLQAVLGRLFATLRRKTAGLTDERVRFTNELLTAIRVVKMYCWEKPFAERIRNARNKESGRILHASYARAASTSPMFFSARLLAFLVFLTYWLDGGQITPEVVYVTLSLFEPVRIVMTVFFPWAVAMLSESRVSCSRVQEFLLLEEIGDTPALTSSQSDNANSDKDTKDEDAGKSSTTTEGRVSALNISASWKEEPDAAVTLNAVSIDVRPGELLAVIGPVGAGKSSLLMALLGELPIQSGKLKTSGRIAYVSQQAWIFSASVRQNVVFGAEYDSVRYQKALKAAALSKDLTVLENGDQTLVGDRGVSLSGGQKARVSLARAVYNDSDVYLMDDPISAVDTAVGKHIFDKCICGALRKKARILVTHQVQYLPRADRILVLKAGEVLGYGTYEELLAQGLDFESLVEKESEADVATPSIAQSPISQSPLRSLPPASVGSLPADSFIDHLSKSLEKSYLDKDEVAMRPLLAKSVEKGSHPMVNGSRGNLSEMRKSQLSLAEKGASITAGSLWSLGSLEDLEVEFVAPVQKEEEKSEGSIGLKLYYQYLRFGAGIFGLIVCTMLCLLAQLSSVMCEWWLAIWSSRNQQYLLYQQELVLYNSTNMTDPRLLDDVTTIEIFAGITAACIVFGFIRILHLFHIMVKASQNANSAMFKKVIRLPILFFDTNPVGRILNRFSKDTGLLDDMMPWYFHDFVQVTLVMISIVVVAAVINPWVIIPIVPLAIVFVVIRVIYLKTSRDVKRIEGTTRSPIFSHLSASLNGLASIRAYHMQSVFSEEFDRHLDTHSSSWSLFLTTARWFCMRLDLLSCIFISIVVTSCIPLSDNLDAGLIGMSIVQTINLMGTFQFMIRLSADIENLMTSAERIIEYSELEEEASLTSNHPPPSDWPTEGGIEAEDVSLQYSANSPTVLKSLTFSIKPREKVGIVGRTGAGKSSLIAMLFRLAEPTGSLVIDGVNILNIGLHELRKTVAIIPQDPVLFSGTVRYNLDPFEQHSDEALWQALEETQLKTAVMELDGELSAKLTEGGSNFSVGQRQLLCLARAILKRNRIMVIDEATANVDPSTDALIQETIRRTFADCTVLTIAHRLNTIMDSDRIMVLELGNIMEFDKPSCLLDNPDSLFYKMAAQLGDDELQRLCELSKDKKNK